MLLLTIAAGASIGWLLPAGPVEPESQRPTAGAANATPKPVVVPPQRPSTSIHREREIVIARMPDGHFYTDAMVNGRPVRFLIDTGATGVALTAGDARNIGLPFSPGEFTVIGKGASGDVRGKLVTIDRIAIGDIEATRVPGAIIDEGLEVSLLGQSFLSRVSSVSIADNRMTLR